MILSDITWSTAEIMAAIAFAAAAAGGYWRLALQLGHLERKMDAMSRRNEAADLESDAVKVEQAAQRMTVAVMAEQMRGVTNTLGRIDRNVEELIKKRTTP